jgi:hypothetical protein
LTDDGFKMMFNKKPAWLHADLEGNRFKFPHSTCTWPLPPSVKKRHSRQFATYRQKKENEIMNSPRTKLHICKPRHTSRCFSLQKSSFLADAPQEIEYLADYKFWIIEYEI